MHKALHNEHIFFPHFHHSRKNLFIFSVFSVFLLIFLICRNEGISLFFFGSNLCGIIAQYLLRPDGWEYRFSGLFLCVVSYSESRLDDTHTVFSEYYLKLVLALIWNSNFIIRISWLLITFAFVSVSSSIFLASFLFPQQPDDDVYDTQSRNDAKEERTL